MLIIPNLVWVQVMLDSSCKLAVVSLLLLFAPFALGGVTCYADRNCKSAGFEAQSNSFLSGCNSFRTGNTNTKACHGFANGHCTDCYYVQGPNVCIEGSLTCWM